MPEIVLLEDLDIYKLAMEIGEEVWEIVEKWSYFPKKTVGGQFVEAGDSIAANIAEGYGRYFYRDRRLYYYYARGSLMETKTWTLKSLRRNLISTEKHASLYSKMVDLLHKLNVYIKKLKQNIAEGREHL